MENFQLPMVFDSINPNEKLSRSVAIGWIDFVIYFLGNFYADYPQFAPVSYPVSR